MAYVNIKRQDLELVKKIGLGGYSAVFQATWKSQEVAAKRLTEVDRHEVDVLSKLEHPNIVKLIGVVDENFDYYLVLELCKGGSLRSYLDQQRLNGKRLSAGQFIDWATQAARPIQYLKEKQIVHKDVKSTNYVIADGNILKLADFGLAKNIESTIKNATQSGTRAYMAPELLRDFILSPTFDIFSYGVVIWELFTTEIPFEGDDPVNIVWRVCQNNERLPIPADYPKPLADLMRQCWETDWHKRPTIDHILSVLYSTEKEFLRQRLITGPWVLEKVFGQHGPDELSDARNIAVNPNGDIAVADWDALHVKVYSSEGDCKFNLNAPHGTPSMPWNVSVSSDGNYYVIDTTQYVKVYDVNGGYKGQWAAVSPDNKPSDNEDTELIGLAMDGKDQLFVGEWHHKYISKHIQDGSHIASIKVDIVPCYLAVTSQDTIIVSDWLGKVVNIVDNTGKVLHTLKPPLDAMPWYPCGVCCYEDIIFICNQPMPPHLICYFSLSGEYLGSIAVTGRFPYGITFVQGSNRLLLACRGRVQVYSCKAPLIK